MDQKSYSFPQWAKAPPCGCCQIQSALRLHSCNRQINAMKALQCLSYVMSNLLHSCQGWLYIPCLPPPPPQSNSSFKINLSLQPPVCWRDGKDETVSFRRFTGNRIFSCFYSWDHSRSLYMLYLAHHAVQPFAVVFVVVKYTSIKPINSILVKVQKRKV